MPLLASQRLIDSNGRSVSIAQEPLAVGGEGSIYDVVGDSSIVAKVYKAPQPKDRSEKLRAMAGLMTPDLLKIAAWPTATLHSAPGGPVTGILMPKISGHKEIHHLYSVTQRKKDYPDADWRFLTHAARNCAIAFETIHDHGHVVGDVNQKNVLVSTKAIVQFVDCDSFQIRAADGLHYRCAVGVPDYTPPELQGKSFSAVDREPNHDRFGLAVLIFHLLMMGRHPFSGVYLDAGDMPLEKAIQGGRYAYSRNSQATRMRTPPNTLPLTMLDASLVSLFERAFAPIGPGGPPARPTATEWKDALGGFLAQLGPCKIDPKHIYPKQAGACPWCQLLGSTGLFFFLAGAPATGGNGQPFHLVAIWGRIERIAAPVVTYTRPSPPNPLGIVARPIPANVPPLTSKPMLHPVPSAPKKPDTFLDRIAGVGALAGVLILLIAPPIGVGCLTGFGIWWAFLRLTSESRKAKQRRAHEAEKQKVAELNDQLIRSWEAKNQEWNKEYRGRASKRDGLAAQLSNLESTLDKASRTAAGLFLIARKNLESSKAAYEGARAEYSKDMADLAKRAAQLQLEHHLDSFLIRGVKLKNMTTGRIASLSSFGIETALDVKMLKGIKVPGIGPVLTNRLFDWRESLARSFKPKPGVPDAERAVVDSRYRPRLGQLEVVLSDGSVRLKEIVNQYDSRRSTLTIQIQTVVYQLAQAESDVKVMDRLQSA
ncbi:MAG: hypothetical protein ACLQU5_13670 [Isosphaeraceae bacterium]